MEAPNYQLQVEGQWEELLKDAGRFAGYRVRITVLSEPSANAATRDRIGRWLREGDALQLSPPKDAAQDHFGDSLAEKYRKQGLVI